METTAHIPDNRPIAAAVPVRIFLAALALGLTFLVWMPSAVTPAYQFGVRAENGLFDPGYTVESGPWAGATVDLGGTSLTQRLRLASGAPRNATMDVPVDRDGQTARVRLSATRPGDEYFPYAVAVVQTIAILAGFLIAIRLPAIMGLSFLLAVSSIDVTLLDGALANLEDPAFVWIAGAVNALFDTFPSYALLVFASRLPDNRLPRWRQPLVRIADAIAVAGFFTYLWVAFTLLPLRSLLSLALIAVPMVFIVVFAALVLARSRGAQRTRIAVVMTALIAYEATYFLSEISGSEWNPHSTFYILDMTISALVLPAAVAYAAFRHRLLDLGFVLNKTAVIGITSALLVPIFGIMEWLAERYLNEANHAQGLAVELVIVVVIFASFRFLHGKVDVWVDDFVFRERHEDELALLEFAHSAAFYTKREAAVREALALVRERGRVTEASLYVDDGAAYAAEVTTPPEPREPVDSDDPAAVALRASGKPVDLAHLKTAIPGERAYPLMLASRLQGMLVVGPRTSEEQMPPDIDRAVRGVADALGKALESIEKERLREEIEEARLDASRARRDAEAAWRALEALKPAPEPGAH